MSDSPAAANPDWLDNTHPGEMLTIDFMEPPSLDAAALARAVDLPEERLSKVIAGERPVDAELDLRLGRYFGMSDGFFMRLQVQHDLLEAKRTLNGRLEHILPRAA